MLILSLLGPMWLEMFPDMTSLGKVLLLPFFVFATLSVVIGGVCEFLLIDIWVLLIFAFSKSVGVRGLLEYLRI